MPCTSRAWWVSRIAENVGEDTDQPGCHVGGKERLRLSSGVMTIALEEGLIQGDGVQKKGKVGQLGLLRDAVLSSSKSAQVTSAVVSRELDADVYRPAVLCINRLEDPRSRPI